MLVDRAIEYLQSRLHVFGRLLAALHLMLQLAHLRRQRGVQRLMKILPIDQRQERRPLRGGGPHIVHGLQRWMNAIDDAREVNREQLLVKPAK
ncbi:hypothetical protein [Bradyrhizobium sp.]|uniref:hypothetical protein n=1 Tax=Bradyrhizobium sp. TaxID=376 RepID=UPI002D7EE8CE|nr:hypothetical protein [Bradyrhizobium sp.]